MSEASRVKRYELNPAPDLLMPKDDGHYVLHSDIAARDKRHAGVVRWIEWTREGPGAQICCPTCGRAKYGGHSPDCQLAAMLRDLEAT